MAIDALHHDTRMNRLGATSGVLWFVLTMVGNTLNTAGTDQSAKPSGEQILADLQRTSTTADIGFAMELLGFLALLVFLGYLYATLRRTDEGTWLPATALVGGVTMIAIKLGSGAPLFAAMYRKDEITPDLARTLVDINSGAFWISWLPFAVLVTATAASLLSSHLVARPLAWTGVVFGVAGLVPAVSLPVALTDFGAAPFMLSYIWLAVIAAVLVFRPARVASSPARDVTVSA
jgi:hypothetical protein